MQDHRRSRDCSGVDRTHQCCVTTSGSRFTYSMDDFGFSAPWKSNLARHVVLWLQHVQSFLKSLCVCVPAFSRSLIHMGVFRPGWNCFGAPPTKSYHQITWRQGTFWSFKNGFDQSARTRLHKETRNDKIHDDIYIYTHIKTRQYM